LHVYELVERLDKLLDWIVRLQVFESQFLESHGLEKPLFSFFFRRRKNALKKTREKNRENQKNQKPKNFKKPKIRLSGLSFDSIDSIDYATIVRFLPVQNLALELYHTAYSRV